MHSRLIRTLLVVVAIAIGVAAGYFLKAADQTMTTDRAAVDTLRDQARALRGTIADVRAAQVAYVARGQGEDFWMLHVSNLMPGLERQMAEFHAKLSAPPAQAAFELASAAIENFQKLDRRAQEFVSGGNSLLAADLIFSDGLEATSTASLQVEAALNAELRARQIRDTARRREQLAILGGGAGGVLLLLVALGLTGAAPKAAPAPEPVEQEPPAVELPATPNLSNAARLCTDLGRVLESTQLPGLLERTAKVIDASGLVIWMADPAGDLRPAMSFGYSDASMAKMGSIPRDANNAAAAAYRAGEMRTVRGDTVTSGALVAPLMTPDGCVGVLSAEMKGGSEKNESSQALAAIVAAQLATLVSPPPASPHKAAAQG